MKKIMAIISILFVIVGCSFGNTPTYKVETYLNRYINNDKDIMSQVDEYLMINTYTNEQKEKYREIIKKQHQNMKYEIKDEKINGDKATVTTEVKVYDFYKVNKIANEYLLNNADKFYDENISYSEKKYIDYVLDKMEKNNDTITNTIIFNLEKINGKWVISEIPENDLMKIYGTYEYE